MATKVYFSRHQYLRKNPKLNALFYYFPEAALISTYTTEILISHCFNITTDGSITNSNNFHQIRFGYIWIFNDSTQNLYAVIC